MSEQEIKPCPFCGKSFGVVVQAVQLCGEDMEDDQRSGFSAVVCDASKPNKGCGAMGGFFSTEETAIAAWNARALASLPDSAGEAGPEPTIAEVLDWAASLATLEDPRTSDWRYDDLHELAKAIRKGPDDWRDLLTAKTSAMRDGLLALSHLLDDAAQGIDENCAYEFATQMRVLLGLDGEPAPHPVGSALTEIEIRNWWASENGLEDCNMCRMDDFRTVVRAVEQKLALAAAPAPAVKGYHPGVSGEAGLMSLAMECMNAGPDVPKTPYVVLDEDTLAAFVSRLAAPSHPPATPASRTCGDGCNGCESCIDPDYDDAKEEPAVAVQAEPSELLRQRANEIASMAKPDYFNKVRAAVLALAAHPKPAAPATAEELPDSVSHYGLIDERVGATADDAVSDEMLDEITQAVFSHCDSNGYAIEPDTVYDLVKFTMDALRSGASAQPAGGAT